MKALLYKRSKPGKSLWGVARYYKGTWSIRPERWPTPYPDTSTIENISIGLKIDLSNYELVRIEVTSLNANQTEE